MIHIFGIRHHGSGSARNLLRALEETKPDILLIECPSDCQPMIKFIDFEEMLPPVALLVYETSDLSNFAYYPFTVFSPEWQAMRFAGLHQIPVRFIDLPFSQTSKFPDKRKERKDSCVDDPFRMLAAQAGFQDIERWWEITFELDQSGHSPFNVIIELMKVIRIDVLESDPLILAREAYMRSQIRNASKEQFKSIAVVCGAWHAPALHANPEILGPVTRQLPEPRSKVNTGSTWVPWSYSNIARMSGYAAGVVSPYWYEALFFHGSDAVHYWFSRVAGILRTQHIAVSPADMIECSRLAHALASMRDQPLPGINELYDAVISVCTHGDDTILSVLTKKILIGEGIGFVPTTVPGIPLQQDIERSLKMLRLFSLWQKPGNFEKNLDLRKKTHQRASVLFHRLNLIGVTWAHEQPKEGNPLGAFAELWVLQWQPEFSLIIIDKSRWGNTLKEAVIHYLEDILSKVTNLPDLSALLLSGLRANIHETILPVIRQIQDIGHGTNEVLPLLRIFPDLVWSHRYGSGMEFLRAQIGLLISDLFPRMCILLPDSARHVNDEKAEQLYGCLVSSHHAIHLIEQPEDKFYWYNALHKIISTDGSHPLVVGLSLKLLFSKGQVAKNQVVEKLRYELSQLSEIINGGLLLEGFLRESGWWLIHYPSLMEVVDDWIGDWNDDQFLQYLPVLRRIFASYSKTEKQVLIDLIRNDSVWASPVYPDLEPRRQKFFIKVLERLNLTSGNG